MFKVKHTINGNIETVYDVRHDREESRHSFSGHHDDVQFLIYSKEDYGERYEWAYVDACYYEPYEDEEVKSNGITLPRLSRAELDEIAEDVVNHVRKLEDINNT